MEWIEKTLEGTKRVALIAHDAMKQELIDWCAFNRPVLERHILCGTGTTARLISQHTGLAVERLQSGPLGGDQQVGGRIVEGQVDVVIFFSDPLTAQLHDPDVKALLRIAQVYDIPIALSRATADFLISSPLFHTPYTHRIRNYAALRAKLTLRDAGEGAT